MAVRTAQILRRRLRLASLVSDQDYVRTHERLFSADNVEWAGKRGGASKTAARHEFAA